MSNPQIPTYFAMGWQYTLFIRLLSMCNHCPKRVSCYLSKLYLHPSSARPRNGIHGIPVCLLGWFLHEVKIIPFAGESREIGLLVLTKNTKLLGTAAGFT